MYRIKTFTASTPYLVEDQANEWLKKCGEENCIRLVQVTPTDVVQVTSNCGIQRYTLVLVYKVLHRSGRS